VRAAGPQSIERRRLRLTDSVVGRIVAPTPPVEYEKHHRSARLHVIPWVFNAPSQRCPRRPHICASCAQSPVCGQLADIEACSERIMSVPLIYRLNADSTAAEKRDLAA
jgi:hypothetical protein